MAIAGVVAFAGCAGTRQLVEAPQEAAQITASEHVRTQPSRQVDGRLLYVSDASGVHIYSYPKGRPVGELTGLSAPAGECSDKNGNVWITNFSAATIVEYAHGGNHPIATLSDPGFKPQGCAVDPTTGDLAVAEFSNDVNGPSQPGSFTIFAKATGAPHLYSVPFASTSWCGYDNKGNLFVDGFGWSEEPLFALVELKKGANVAKPIEVDQTIGEPGAVQWYAQHLLIGDDEAKAVYKFAIYGGRAKEVGATSVDFGEGRMGQFWVQGSRLIVPTYIGSGASVRFFTYPGGAGPTKSINGLDYPSGVAVSVAPQ